MASTWAQRIQSAVTAIGFDSLADLGSSNDPNTVRSLQDPAFSIYLKPDEDYSSPVIDTAVKTPGGAGSLKFTHVPFTREGMQGTFYFNFSDDGSLRFGANETFYIQWRQRFDQNWINTLLINNDGESYEPVTISGISKANPATVTYTGSVHPASGSYVLLRCKSGMTALHNKMCRAANVNTVARTFQLQNLDGTNVNTTGYPNFGTASFHTTAYQQVTSITRTNPAVVTYVGADPDPLLDGYLYASFFVEGMTQLQRVVARVKNVNTTSKTFQLEGVDATGFSPFTAGVVRVGTLQGGIKQIDTTAGDLLTWNGTKWVSDATTSYSTSSENKIVTQSAGQFRFTKLYHYNLDGANADLYDNQGSDFLYHNQLVPPGTWSSIQPPDLPPNPGTNFPWYPDEWMTFQLMVKLGPEGTATSVTGTNITGPVWLNSEVKLWCARQGQPQQLVHWYKPGIGGYEHQNRNPTPGVTNDPTGPKYGKVNIFPFCTAKGVAQDHPVMTTWVDEVIVSTSFIDDPLDDVVQPQPSSPRIAIPDRIHVRGSVSQDIAPNPVVSGSVAATESKDVFAATNQQYPTWRQGRTKDVWADIPNTAPLVSGGGPYTSRAPSDDLHLISGWNGFARIGNEWWSTAASGHGAWQNPVLKIDLGANTPAWTIVDMGSVFADAPVSVDYYLDGRATGRHTYYTPCGVPAGVCPDGKKRVIMPTAFARWDPDNGGNYSYDVWGYRCDDGVANPNTNQWDANDFWPPWPGYPDANIASVCQDPRDYKMYVTLGDADNGFCILDPATKTWRQGYTNPGYPNTSRVNGWPHYPTLIDTLRNRLVAFANSPFADPPETVHRFTTVDLSHAGTAADPYPLAVFAWSGDAVTSAAFGPKSGRMVHDLDNDRYLLLHTNSTQTGCDLYSIDPLTWVVTKLNKSIAGLVGTDAVESKFHYFPALGGCAVLRKGDVNIQFFPTR